ncbi:hypothetical protein EXIGLDRAFT_700064 [Exidia glandulosa HHB12029]|uniref:Uncharacterized protein n=1 Tax=Exidia glandulosa HHB12029 TaxID=1314781 RepID=A0A165FQP4_EXIGL|nr:hypothetical protein EXIGLDRAFT_695679 [Exidia glandulosa HHB12029]KZV98834.1 hypothetical protein EXIGLDRAFT_700064 [Exidia glandulosa HHB12029]
MQRPHARAFLLEGGLSWRIARVFLDEVDAMAGPSTNARQLGSPAIADIGFSSGNGYDDFISEEEREILMGRVNDQFIFPNPRDFRSSHATWDGVWTEEDEAWFIDHLRYFIDGDPIFSQQRWRARIRADGATRRHRGHGFREGAVPGLKRGRGKGKSKKGKEKEE